MKYITILSFLFATTIIFSQEFVSNKQKYLIGYDIDYSISNDLKSIIIDSNRIIAELPNGEKYSDEIKFEKEQLSGGKVGKRYRLQNSKSSIVVIYDDEVFLNVNGEIAVTYFLTHYKERTKEQLEILNKESERFEYQSNVALYGVFTADCIREKKIKIGMNYMAIEKILGNPDAINTTQTENQIMQQYVYDDLLIYIEFDRVTTIQHRNHK